EGGWPSLEGELEGVEGVLEAETLICLPIRATPNMRLEVSGEARDLRVITENYTKLIYVVALSQELAERVELKILSGSWNLSGHGALVSSRLASSAEIGVGDTVALAGTLMGHTAWRSIEVEVKGIIYLGEDAVSLIRGILFLMRRPVGRWARASSYEAPLVICVSYETMEELLASVPGGEEVDVAILYYIWADRGELIDPWNLDATEDNLREFELDLMSVADELGLDVMVYLSYAVGAYSSALDSIRVLTGALSFPVFLLSWYLVLTAGYLVSGARRREVGLLRVRGASSRKIFASYMATALLIGLAGSLLGILAGMGLAWLYLALSGEELPWEALLGPLDPSMLGIEVGLGCAVCLVASVRPAKMASSLSPVEATKEYVEVEATEAWKFGRLRALAFALGSVKMVEWVMGIRPLDLLEQVQGLPFFIMVAFFIYVMIDVFVLNFLGPIFFLYGATCLLVRSSRRLYRLASALAKPLGFIGELASRSLSRNPARASRVAFLVSMAIAFGSVMSLLSASVMDAQVRMARTVVGSDVRVEVFEDVGPDFSSDLEALDGVRGATPVVYGSWLDVKLVGQVDYYVVEPGEFADLAYIEEGFCHPDMREALASMAEDEHEVLVSEKLADLYYLAIGSTIYIRSGLWAPEEDGYVRVVVAGIVEVFPGSAISPFAEDLYVVVSFKLAEELGLPTSGPYFLVAVEEGAEAGEVAEEIERAYPDEVSDVSTVEEVLAESPLIMVGNVIYTFLRQSFLCSLAAAASGLGLTAMMSVRERTYEVGLVRARGMGRKKVLLSLAYEYLMVAILGLAIGLSTGLATAYGLVGMMSDVWPIEVRMLFPADFWAFLGLGMALFLASSLIPALLSFRRTVVETIRFR
ncbi:hypothetical protein DRO32_04805, partial [Candidatus Bathyarchaeota archaeon]